MCHVPCVICYEYVLQARLRSVLKINLARMFTPILGGKLSQHVHKYYEALQNFR